MNSARYDSTTPIEFLTSRVALLRGLRCGWRKLLESAASGFGLRVVGSEGGFADLQGAFELGARAVQVAQGRNTRPSSSRRQLTSISDGPSAASAGAPHVRAVMHARKGMLTQVRRSATEQRPRLILGHPQALRVLAHCQQMWQQPCAFGHRVTSRLWLGNAARTNPATSSPAASSPSDPKRTLSGPARRLAPIDAR